MTQNLGKSELIAKLLRKAEDPATNDAEREALTERAFALMLKYEIDEMTARASVNDTATPDTIERRIIVPDAPKTYSHEYCTIGISIALAFGARGILTVHQGKTALALIGFSRDLDTIAELFASSALQCTLSLGTWFARNGATIYGGSDRYKARRSFIRGFADGLRTKLLAQRKVVINEAGTGAALALVDRGRKVDDWVRDNMNVRTIGGRRYGNGHQAGTQAGLRADTGQAATSNAHSRRAIGG